LKLNTKKNKQSVCKELGFNPDKLIITYAPAGKYSYPFKQGASLAITPQTLNYLGNNSVVESSGYVFRPSWSVAMALSSSCFWA